MVLAAGEAQRLRPLTDNLPKPMLSIAGRPILEHNVRLLVQHGVADIIINVHHCADVIRAHFLNGSRFGARIIYSEEPILLGTAGAVKLLESEFTSTFLVVYGDNLTDCDIGKFVAWHRERGAQATIALFNREDVQNSGVVEVDAQDRVKRFVEKPRPEEVFSHWVNAGILVLEPSVLQSIPVGFSDFGRDVLPRLINSDSPVYGYRMSEQLWWIDSPEDYDRTRQMLDGATVPSHRAARA